MKSVLFALSLSLMCAPSFGASFFSDGKIKTIEKLADSLKKDGHIQIKKDFLSKKIKGIFDFSDGLSLYRLEKVQNPTVLMWIVSHCNNEKYMNLLKYLQVEALLRESVNIKDKCGWSPLMIVARKSGTHKNFQEAINILIHAGAEVNAQNYHGRTPLMLAAEHAHHGSSDETVQLLINAGADVNARGPNGLTPLMMAASYVGHESSDKTVQLLINAGAEVNAQDNYGWTPLMMAARYADYGSSYEIVQLLINSGANLDLLNDKGQSALSLAIKSGDQKTIRLIKEHMAEPSCSSSLPNPLPLPEQISGNKIPGPDSINGSRCCICMERPINTIWPACGHLNTCAECAPSLDETCPTCRQKSAHVVFRAIQSAEE